MTLASARPPRTLLASGLEISRIVTGLWQVADMERSGAMLDPVRGAAHLAEYAAAGFDSFDMADHYGSAEVITGTLLASPQGRGVRAFTKWCPEPGPMTAATVREGVQRALDRLRVARIDLMQFHWWSFEHPGYLDAMLELARLREEGLIAHLGLTNFDTAHLRVLLAQGIPIASNQVCLSLLDRRATADMARLCLQRNVKLLAYGTLAGGFLSERWLGAAEPVQVDDWSKMKYRRFIDAVGGFRRMWRPVLTVRGGSSWAKQTPTPARRCLQKNGSCLPKDGSSCFPPISGMAPTRSHRVRKD
jgi:aryl-alcohol dehydrogenase-like predicted oxidoreductase